MTSADASISPVNVRIDESLRGKEPPPTARGIRTRASLVEAARRVFERDGFLTSRLTDIAVEAKCSTGTFYTYFNNKEEIFAAVLDEAQKDMLHPGMEHVPSDDDPAAKIEASNRAYLAAYERNKKLMVLLNQVSAIDARFWDFRRARGWVFNERNAAEIARLQAAGRVDPTLDPMMTAMALSSMVSRMAHHYLAREQVLSVDQITDIVTKLWVNALKLDE